jgi:hypothetical protein
MDGYTKLVLTLIAIALFILNLQMLRPHGAVVRFDNTPTWGELMDLKDIKDETERRNKIMDIYRRIPFVRVEGSR